ncbi:PREDICTED: MATH domain and coiled-coil domain-containing protein At2g42470-like [Camelina sativa]|uniref:MATH domain and coiled-coil domain-containing protein At2g42470-like n=1 Tax=Camelina sativa TaxID=90675 RepID=A0ABM0WB94_CAMSA|nr:PREDICTED: MATH domain and coiled-coil domain-containing protein At2g42470-like [Camelina sativa]
MVEDQKETTSFTFEIDNFWEKEADVIRSPIFSSGGGCEWYVDVYPKGYGAVKDHLSVHFGVATPESLRLGWKRRANTSLVLLNQSGKELYSSPKYCYLFCAQLLKWGDSRVSTHKKLKEEGLLENNNKLIVQVEIKIVEEGDITGNEMLDVRGFQVLYSQVPLFLLLFGDDSPFLMINIFLSLTAGYFSDSPSRGSPGHCSKFHTKDPIGEDSVHECPPRSYRDTEQASRKLHRD